MKYYEKKNKALFLIQHKSSKSDHRSSNHFPFTVFSGTWMGFQCLRLDQTALSTVTGFIRLVTLVDNGKHIEQTSNTAWQCA